MSAPDPSAQRVHRPLSRRIYWKVKNLFCRQATLDEPEFDRRYGIATGGFIDRAELDGGENQAHGTDYHATTRSSLERLCETIAGDRSSMTFVDLGCGLGRALFAAYELGFGKMVGIEYSPSLYEALCENLDNGALCDVDRARFDAQHGDAATFELPLGDCVVFMFNPFDATILQKVADNLVASYDREPRAIRVVYYNPLHQGVLDADPRFKLTHAGDLTRRFSIKEDYGYAVYRLIGATQRVEQLPVDQTCAETLEPVRKAS